MKIDKKQLLFEIKDSVLIDEVESFLSDDEFIEAVDMLLNKIIDHFISISDGDVEVKNSDYDISEMFMIEKPDYSEFGGYESGYERDMEKGFLVEAHEED